MLIGQPIASLWYWCIDQEMVQRVLSARGVDHAQGGTVMAACLKLLPVFMIVFPGMAARTLYQMCLADQSGVNEKWYSFVYLFVRLLPS
jgi:uncharacterized sodium:solute symporter family permease YidK